MAHFAKLDDNNIVTEVIVVNNSILLDENGVEQEELGIKFLKSLYNSSTNWKQCSYSMQIRKAFPGIGYIYNPTTDTFISPVPYPSWTLDINKGEFVPPIPMPIDGKEYFWDEELKIWIEIPDEGPGPVE